jgi:RimJ/RimL family protein N-acetyltransferase
VRKGIWDRESLIGLASLTLVAPRTFVLGYWIDADHTGKGIVTASCRALMRCAQHRLDAVEFWAGVRHANVKRAAVSRRLGLSVYERLPDRNRFRLRRDG